jgi:TIR domain
MSSNIDRFLERQANIFINYRREDTAGHAGRLFDRLNGRFPDRVFMDIDTIEPGIDFVEIIRKAVGCCEVLIVMIGRNWLTLADGTGRRRLDNPNDFVRLEIGSALVRDEIRIIPVLVEGAVMPRPEDLPPDLALLTRRNAIELSDARWAFDVDRLLQTIEGVLVERAPSALMPVTTLPAEPPPPPEPAPVPHTVKARAWLAAMLVVVALAAWIGWKLERPGTASNPIRDKTPVIDVKPLEQTPEATPASPVIRKEPTVKHEASITRRPAEKTGLKKKATDSLKRLGKRARNWRPWGNG